MLFVIGRAEVFLRRPLCNGTWPAIGPFRASGRHGLFFRDLGFQDHWTVGETLACLLGAGGFENGRGRLPGAGSSSRCELKSVRVNWKTIQLRLIVCLLC